MLKFASLTKAQKQCMIAYIEQNPSLRQTGQISLKDLVALHHEIADKRDSGAPKVGFPNWMTRVNKIDRGMYQLPLPTDAELSQFAKEMAQSTTKPKAVKAPAKVKKVVAQKKIATPAATDAETEMGKKTRIEQIIDESDAYDQDEEDFNAILRENGITV